MNKLDRLLNLVQSQVGYTEKDNDKDLDTMVRTTAGSGNHTKYAGDVTATGLPGYCGSAWCGVYQFWLDMQTAGKDQALEHFGPSSTIALPSGIMPNPRGGGCRRRRSPRLDTR